MALIQDIRGARGPSGARRRPRSSVDALRRLRASAAKMDAPSACGAQHLLGDPLDSFVEKCAAGQKGAPIFCRACARRAAATGSAEDRQPPAGPGGRRRQELGAPHNILYKHHVCLFNFLQLLARNS